VEGEGDREKDKENEHCMQHERALGG